MTPHLKSDQEWLEEFEERFPGPLMFKEEIKSFLVKLRQEDRRVFREKVASLRVDTSHSIDYANGYSTAILDVLVLNSQDK